MPLPDGGGEWPPPVHAPVLDKMTEWSAWYSGDANQLSVYYGGENADAFDSVSRARIINRPSQYRGGVVGKLARWWWGQPTPQGDRRTKIHLPLAGDIAAVSSRLLFSEPPTLAVDHAPTQAWLDELVENGIRADLLEAAEVCAALGGVYLRTVWDEEIRPEGPWLSAVHADAAIPEWRWNVLRAVTFWRVVAEDGKRVIRHLERHEPGAIFHGLYEGDCDDLGRKIPLTELPETADIAESLTDGDMIETKVKSLTAGYCPNIRPNRVWRALPAAANLGRSDYSGVESFMDSIDEVYASLMRDVRIGKGRLIAPSSYLEDLGPGRGAGWIDREVYEAVEMLGGSDRMELQAHQFAIRVADHLMAIEHLQNRIVSMAGYASQTFGETGDVAVTATEVKARERKSMTTRDQKAQYWGPFLGARLQNLAEVARMHFEREDIEPVRPRVMFGDSVSEDLLSLAQTAAALRQAEAASTKVLVTLVHPDWDETQIDEETERIREERGSIVGDPFAIRPDGATIQPGDPDEEPVEDAA
ncbi:phage portal protein [Nonomuraea sp. NN258]|uniref:phage portal protein n=1 Tax=Nonomuraea antri TaxID=2730852 RepID=UPI001568F324|nr:phage portal protein [Nonomuraea antri]NRQ35992.1 phage portal protein [Nonomuraea antri]